MRCALAATPPLASAHSASQYVAKPSLSQMWWKSRQVTPSPHHWWPSSWATTPSENAPRLGVNPAAVVQRGGKSIVYLVKGDKVVETPVTVGGKLGDWAVITAGLKAGDKVAMSPLDKLKDGTKVKEAVE